MVSSLYCAQLGGFSAGLSEVIHSTVVIRGSISVGWSKIISHRCLADGDGTWLGVCCSRSLPWNGSSVFQIASSFKRLSVFSSDDGRFLISKKFSPVCKHMLSLCLYHVC